MGWRSHRDICVPITERSPAVAINSIEETGDNWCRSTVLAAPDPAEPFTAKFPPTTTVFCLDTGNSTSVDIAILAISKSND